MEKTRFKPKELLPYGMLLTRLFKHVVSVSPELAFDHYLSHDRAMHPLAPHYERKTRADRGMKRPLKSRVEYSRSGVGMKRYTQIDINYAAGGNLRGLSAEEAWETIMDCAQCDKQWKTPTSTISDQTIANLKDQLVGNEVVRVKIPSYVSWLDAYDEPLGDLDRWRIKWKIKAHKVPYTSSHHLRLPLWKVTDILKRTKTKPIPTKPSTGMKRA
ncbi:hypothetical protein Tco_0742507 [Tanacetum coccineum]